MTGAQRANSDKKTTNSQFCNSDQITFIIFKLLQIRLHFITLDSIGALLRLSLQVMSPNHAD